MKSRNEIIIKELESRKEKKQGEKDGKKKRKGEDCFTSSGYAHISNSSMHIHTEK